MLAESAQKRIKTEIPKEDYQHHTISSITLDWDASANVAAAEEEYLWGGFKTLSLF